MSDNLSGFGEPNRIEKYCLTHNSFKFRHTTVIKFSVTKGRACNFIDINMKEILENES